MKIIRRAKSLLHIVVSITILAFLELDKTIRHLLIERTTSFYFSLLTFGVINFYFVYFGFYLPFIKKKIVDNLYRDYKIHIQILTIDTFLALISASVALCSNMGVFGILSAFLLIHINFKFADFIPTLHSVGQTEDNPHELEELCEKKD